mgnify:CR=1 FL=1
MSAASEGSSPLPETGPTAPYHPPCMLEEVLHWLDLQPGQAVADLTVGLAGHGREIIRRIGPDGTYVGLEWDAESLALARQALRDAPNAHLFSENMVDLPTVLAGQGLEHIDAALLDAGPNLWQLTAPHRSLTQDSDAGLDMRMSPATQAVTAETIVAEATEAELREILRVTLAEGEARRIARAVVRARAREPIRTTRRLAEVILAATPPPARYTGRMPMPALLAFRIRVNAEIDNLREGILAAVSVLRPGSGRLVVLTFHSAEFRVCRQVMKELARGCVCPPRMVRCECGRKPRLRLLTPRPLAPDAASLERSGPQCRSCRLHAAQAV